MIRTLHVQNYKCLRDVRVELKPFTVLIGKNDTGKSSLLEAIHTLAKLVGPSAASQRGPWAIDKLAWRGADPPSIAWKAEIEPSTRNGLPGVATYSLRVAPAARSGADIYVDDEKVDVAGSNAPDVIAVPHHDDNEQIRKMMEREQTLLSQVWKTRGYPMHKAVARALSATVKYRFDPAKLSQGAVYEVDPEDPEREPRLGYDGSGLPLVLDYLLGAKRSVFDQIEKDLREAVPFIKAIQLKPWRTGKSISFELTAGGYEVAAPLASDGVMLFLAYLTLVHSPGAPAVVLIEEPENGVHPRQLGRIAEYLRRLTDPARGASAVQIVLATHSPYFLDFVPPGDVLVFGRRENGETVVVPLLSLPGVQKRLDTGFSLGEMWFNVGEDRLLAEALA